MTNLLALLLTHDLLLGVGIGAAGVYLLSATLMILLVAADAAWSSHAD